MVPPAVSAADQRPEPDTGHVVPINTTYHNNVNQNYPQYNILIYVETDRNTEHGGSSCRFYFIFSYSWQQMCNTNLQLAASAPASSKLNSWE